MKSLQRDLTNRKAIIAKAGLFVVLTILASSLVVLHQDWRIEVSALTIALWAAARSYYFLFYVMEHYLNIPGPYTGLYDQLRKLFKHRS